MVQDETIAQVETIQEDAQQAQDSHSRTILAALMSGVDEAFANPTGDAEADEASWMQGVENLFKDAETSGRLGELAAVATGQGDEVAPETAVENPKQSETTQHTEESPSSAGYNRVLATAATVSAVAVAINAEMEKQLRDDLASTKAAIARVEREIARLRGEPTTDELDDGVVFTTPLPEDIMSTDPEVLRGQSTQMYELIGKLEADLPGHRETVLRIRDARIEDETKLAGVITELQALDSDGSEAEKEKIGAVLSSIGGYVGSMLIAHGLPPLVSGFDSGISSLTVLDSGSSRTERLLDPGNCSTASRPTSQITPHRKVYQRDVLPLHNAIVAYREHTGRW